MRDMDERDWLATQFEAERLHLRAVAYRMLGSLVEAEDAVQETWLHLSRSDTGGIKSLGAWLTTVVARICLDMLRARTSRHEESLEASVPITRETGEIDPEQEMLLADSVGLALLVILDTLSPIERLAFVLHDFFAIPFDEIAPILGRSEPATRKLASRARSRVRGATKEIEVDLARQREVVDAFLAASREGSFDALLAVLAPNVVLRADNGGGPAGAQRVICGASAVAEQTLRRGFARLAQRAQPVLVNDSVGVAVIEHGRPLLVFCLVITESKIAEINATADPVRLDKMRLSLLASS